MSEPGEGNGWAPLDPDLPGDRPPEPSPRENTPPPGPEQTPYAPGMPYWPGAPAQPPGWDWQYGAYGAPPAKTSWTVAAPAGSPFHRMARTEAHRWWRPLLGSLTVLGIGLGLATGLMLAGMIIAVAVTGELPDTAGADATTIFGNDTADLAFNLLALAVFLPVVLFAAWGIQRRRPGTLSSVAGRLRWKWMLVCGGLAIVFCIVAFGTSLLAGMAIDDQSGGEQWVGWGEFLPPLILIIALVPFQAAAEEYVFRGWLLQAVGACTLENAKRKVGRALSVVFRTPWPGIVVGSALFTSGHGYTGWGMLDIFVFGAIAGWMTVRTGGLEASIALHVFNNMMAFIGSAAVGELDIVQGSVPWQAVVADIVPMALFAAVAVRLARRMRVQTVTPDPAEDDVPVTTDNRPAHIS